MIQFDFAHSESVAKWVADRIPHVGNIGFGKCAAIGVVDDGNPVAGCVYHNYRIGENGKSVIELSFAADAPVWARKKVIATLLAYPFKQLGCEAVMTTVPRKNRKGRRLQKVLGFRQDGVIRKGYGSDDAFVFTMLRDEAQQKWLRHIDG